MGRQRRHGHVRSTRRSTGATPGMCWSCPPYADGDRQVRGRPGRRPALRPRPPLWCARRSAGPAWSPAEVGHVVFGNVIHTEVRDMYLSRVAAVNGGLPVETPAFTAQPAVRQRAAGDRVGRPGDRLGDCDVAVAGGAESMSRGPVLAARPCAGASGCRTRRRRRDGRRADRPVRRLPHGRHRRERGRRTTACPATTRTRSPPRATAARRPPSRRGTSRSRSRRSR